MNKKTILVLLLFLVAIVGILSPANAKLDSKLEVESPTTIGGKTKLILYVDSDIGVKKKNTIKSTYSNSANSISKRKAELNQVNRIVVTVKGHKSLTLKKPSKGWNVDNLYFTKTFSIKGDQKKISDNNCNIKLYNNRNKLLQNKNGKVLFARWNPGDGINSDPKKYFDTMKQKNKNKKNFYFAPFNQFDTQTYFFTLDGAPAKDFVLNTSSSNYFDKKSKFKAIHTKKYVNYASYFQYPSQKMEETKVYTNGKYTLHIKTVKQGNKIYTQYVLFKDVLESGYKTVNNPFFYNSKWCRWTDPSILKLAQSIKSKVNKNDYTSATYKTALAIEVMRYLHTNIKYDNTFEDQTAETVLKRGSGSCVGKSMLAGALLRALDIPAHFEGSCNGTYRSKRMGHLWVVAYIYYENKYQWVPAETTHYYAGSDYTNYVDYKNPFRHNALNWWIIDNNGQFDRVKRYAYTNQ